MGIVIKVENLGKKYIISHQQERYTALRDVMVNTAKKAVKKIIGKSETLPKKEEFWALKNVDFEVSQGDRIGIIGRNGAGKSTLLKLLSKITEPTEGRIKIKGKISSLLEVGTGFHSELTGRENIFLNGAILGMSKKEIQKKFDEIVEFSGVEKFLDTPVKRYSSGMYVRLAFAVASHLESEILLIDEVLAVGDVDFQKKCLSKMDNLVNEEKRTIIFVSHNLSAIKKLCEKTILLDKGELINFSETSQTIKLYTGSLFKGTFVREWVKDKYPQNESMILKSIYICDEKGNFINQIYTDTSFIIKINFETKKDNSFIGHTLLFYDNENNLILSTINNFEGNWYGKQMPKGEFESSVFIPKNLFNNISLSISILMFGRNFTDSKIIENVLNFELLDGIELRKDFFGKFGGILRPKFFWETKFIK